MTPTFAHGKTGQFYITDSGSSSREISAIVKTAGIKQSADTAETSAMGSAAKSYVAGLTDATLSLDGYLDVTTYGYVQGVLGVLTPWIYYPSGNHSGMLELSGSGIVNDLEVTSDVGAVVTVKGTLQVSGAVTVATI